MTCCPEHRCSVYASRWVARCPDLRGLLQAKPDVLLGDHKLCWKSQTVLGITGCWWSLVTGDHMLWLTVGEGLSGVQLQSLEVQLTSLVSIAVSHLQLGPGMPAGH